MNATPERGAIDVRPFDLTAASDAERRGAFDLFCATQERRHPEDPPWLYDAWLRAVEALDDADVFDIRRDVAWRGGEAIGIATSEFLHLPGHEHRLRLGLEVRPHLRTPALERALLRAAVARAHAAGSTTISTRTYDAEPESVAWLEALGLEPGLKTHTNQLRLDDLDPELVAAWIAAAPVGSYEIVWMDGPVPDDAVDAYLELSEVMHDAPMGELEQIREPLRREHLRGFETFMEQRKLESWKVVARRRADGEFGGFTQMVWDPATPSSIFQWETGVRPDHRGQGLGKWIKAAMLDRVVRERPDVRVVRTGNADENAPMLSINRRLGFRPYLAESEWEVDVAQLQALFAR